jgi:hypothetical protein
LARGSFDGKPESGLRAEAFQAGLIRGLCAEPGEEEDLFRALEGHLADEAHSQGKGS